MARRPAGRLIFQPCSPIMETLPDSRETDIAAQTRHLNMRTLLGASPFGGIIPSFNIILPLILHLCWKDKNEQLKGIGSVILNTQITLTLVAFFVYAVYMLMSVFAPVISSGVADTSPGLAIGANLLVVISALIWCAYLFFAWAVSGWLFIQICNNRDSVPRRPFFVIPFFK